MITYKLEERYNLTGTGGTLQTWKECVQCPSGQAVIGADLTTMGRVYTADKYSCASCPDPNMYFTNSDPKRCECPSDMVAKGKETVGEMYCVSSTSAITTSYEVEYFNVQTSVDAAATSSYSVSNSDILEHYLDWAYYNCYADNFVLTSITPQIQRACQTIANLCVMQLYDNDHIACEKYDSIKNNRDGNYYDGISDWKRAAPWLFYSDQAQTVREDREIEMKMSFKKMGGYVNELDYRLGKYTMNGTFVGFETLSNQFSYCGRTAPDTEFGAGDTSSTKFLKFGSSQRETYSCDLETLESEEMFFYDMWIVDIGNTDCASGTQVAADGLCLYPVPVLMRNLREDGQTPNLNFRKTQEVDDIFTRRFFLFDNLSGKKDGNLEILRYAKSIVLQNTIQPENPNKIYPPTLTIEYVERRPSAWTDRADGNTAEEMAIDTLMFKAEYTMDTAEFWQNLEIMVGIFR